MPFRSNRPFALAVAGLLAAVAGPLAGGAAVLPVPAAPRAPPPVGLAAPLQSVVTGPALAPQAPVVTVAPSAWPRTPAAAGPASFPYAPGGDDMLYFEGVLPPAKAPQASTASDAGPAPAPASTTAQAAALARTPAAAASVHPALPEAWEVEADFLGPGRSARFALAQGSHAPGFAERDAQGRWQPRDAWLVDEDRHACARPAGLATADFNGDGRPDVFVACDGPQLLFLSSADGRWLRRETAFELRASAPEAADVDGDGRPDVALRDGPRPLVLYGHGEGAFALGTPVVRAARVSASGIR